MSLIRKLRGRRKGAQISNEVQTPLSDNIEEKTLQDPKAIPTITPSLPITKSNLSSSSLLVPSATSAKSPTGNNYVLASPGDDDAEASTIKEASIPLGSSGAATSSSASSSTAKQDLRKRKNTSGADEPSQKITLASDAPLRPQTTPQATRSRQTWLLLALTSGAFAALNGVFAKLTTTALTSALTHSIATLFSIPPDLSAPNSSSYRILDLTIRALFFALNLVSNGIMWALFTRALTAHSSATQVTILNTSANFLVTAVLGVVVFGERLPALWFLGAAFLLVGSVIIGRKGADQAGSGFEVEVEAEAEKSDSAHNGGSVFGALDELAGQDEKDLEWDSLLDLNDEEMSGATSRTVKGRDRDDNI